MTRFQLYSLALALAVAAVYVLILAIRAGAPAANGLGIRFVAPVSAELTGVQIQPDGGVRAVLNVRDAEDGALIASASISVLAEQAVLPPSDHFRVVMFDAPVALEAGRTYEIEVAPDRSAVRAR